jgi:hypothetical protein
MATVWVRNPNSSDNPVCLSVQSYGTYCQHTASPTIEWCSICLFLETDVYLLDHVADPSTTKYNASYKSTIGANLQQTLEVIVLPK